MEFGLTFLRDKNFLMISAATALVNIALWLLIFAFLGKEKINIILHYNVLFGVDFQGNPREVFTIPAIGLVIFFLNAIITEFIHKKEKLIAYLLLSVSLVSQIFAVIAVAAIILINKNNSH